MIRARRLQRALLGAAFLGIGCTGSITGDRPGSTDPDPSGTKPTPGKPNPTNPTNPSPNPDPRPTPTPTPAPDGTIDLAGPTGLRRLTIFEYNNTIRDLLGDRTSAAAGGAVAVDLASDVGFVNGAKITTSVDARQFLDLSDKLSGGAGSRLATLLPQGCAAPAASAEEGCARNFVKQFGLRAFRRPLTTDEEGDLMTLYTKQRSAEIGANFQDAIKILISGILQSPYFLYRWEIGEAPLKDGVLYRLNSYEIASRLSYFIWASMPDDALFQAAGKNDLQSPDRIAQEARRMLADPKAKDGIRDFTLQWLDVTAVPDLQKDDSYTAYNQDVGKAMLDETAEFMAGVLGGADGKRTLETLLTSNTSYVNAKLATLYGMKGVTGDNLRPMPLAAGERAGILTQGSFLAAKAEGDADHPVKRGVLVLHNVLCDNIPPPVGIDVPPLPDRKPGQTTRQRYEEIVKGKQLCEGCHSRINPVGFAFENYDAVGQYRTQEDGLAVDASGSYTLTSGGAPITFKNAIEFVKQLPQRQEVRDCVSKQWLRYMLRRSEMTKEEGGSLKLLAGEFQKSGYDLREAIIATTKTRAFTHRQPLEGEGLK
jgi:hypothetical protein